MTGMRRCVAGLLSVLAVAACASTDEQSRRNTATSITTTAAGGPSGAAPACRGTGGRLPTGANPILGIHHVPSLTRERYEAVVRTLTGGHDRLESLSDGGIQGLLVHVAGEGQDGFWIIDVWESREAVERFAQRIRPIAQAAGIEEPLKTYPIHTLLSC